MISKEDWDEFRENLEENLERCESCDCRYDRCVCDKPEKDWEE